MLGHVSEHLIWDPSPMNTVFGLFAMDEQEKMDLKNEIERDLFYLDLDKNVTFDEFKAAFIKMNDKYEKLSDEIWEELYRDWCF